MINVTINATVQVHIQRDLSNEDLAALTDTVAKLKALARKTKALAAKY